MDTNDGRWPGRVWAEDGSLRIGERRITFVDSTRELPDWRALSMDVVVDVTG